jgi:hypothetical protein
MSALREFNNHKSDSFIDLITIMTPGMMMIIAMLMIIAMYYLGFDKGYNRASVNYGYSPSADMAP